MADEPIVAPAIAPAAEPAPAAAPAIAPAAEPSPAAAAIEPAAPAAVELAPKPADAPADAPKPEADEPTLLEQVVKDQAKPEGEKKPGEAEAPKTEGEQPKPPIYEFKPYTLPDGVKLDDARLATFNETLVKPDLDPQMRGQALLDLHLGEMTNYAGFLQREQVRVFNETRRAWRNEIASDPVMGGAGFDTTKQLVATARDLFVSEADKPAFDKFLKDTGAGDNPAFWRMLRAVGKKWKEPSPPPPGDQYKPPNDIGKAPRGTSDRRREMYSHANSVARRGE